jgi:hypothetical protein
MTSTILLPERSTTLQARRPGPSTHNHQPIHLYPLLDPRCNPRPLPFTAQQASGPPLSQTKVDTSKTPPIPELIPSNVMDMAHSHICMLLPPLPAMSCSPVWSLPVSLRLPKHLDGYTSLTRQSVIASCPVPRLPLPAFGGVGKSAARGIFFGGGAT